MRHSYPLWCMLLLYALLPCVVGAQTQLNLTLPSSLNFITTLNPIGAGARAQGQGGAFIGVADDATAASHNPGGLVQLERSEMSIVGSYFIRTERHDVTTPSTTLDDQTIDKFNLNYLSLAVPFRFLQRHVVVSANFQQIFDFHGVTEVHSDFTLTGRTVQGPLLGSGRHAVRIEQDGGVFAISPAIAIQVTPAISLGAAVNIWTPLFGKRVQQTVTIASAGQLLSGNGFVPFTARGRVNQDVGVQGVNVTAGFLWTISSVFSLGGVVRTPFTASVTREQRFELEASLLDGTPLIPRTICNARETLDLALPLSYGLGLAARLSAQVRLALDVTRYHWSDLRFLQEPRVAKNPCPGVEVQEMFVGTGDAVFSGASADTTSVRLGVEYLWTHSTVVLPLRAGVFYDPEPGAGGKEDFFGFSLGGGVAAGSWLFDLAYTFRAGMVHGPTTEPRVQQHTMLASMIYHF